MFSKDAWKVLDSTARFYLGNGNFVFQYRRLTMVEWYEKVNMNAKAAYFLALSEKIIDKLASYANWYPIARTTLDVLGMG